MDNNDKGAAQISAHLLSNISGTIFDGRRVINANISETGVEITYQRPSHMALGNGDRVPDSVWKEIYTIKENKLILSDTVQGVHTPAHMVQESIEFPN
jgi:hypothetical protein